MDLTARRAFSARVFVSPRRRAQHTLELLLSVRADSLGGHSVTTTADVAEGDYGACEGLTNEAIVSVRKARGRGAERPWSIWQDGCEAGECVAVCRPSLFGVRWPWRQRSMDGEAPGDVLLACVFSRVMRFFTS